MRIAFIISMVFASLAFPAADVDPRAHSVSISNVLDCHIRLHICIHHDG